MVRCEVVGQRVIYTETHQVNLVEGILLSMCTELSGSVVRVESGRNVNGTPAFVFLVEVQIEFL